MSTDALHLGGELDRSSDGADFDSRSGFRAAVLSLLSEAAKADSPGVREMVWCDADFADWPLGERDTVEALTRWAAQHRRLTLLAIGFGRLEASAPRFVAWRRTWSHIVECRELPDVQAHEVPGHLLLKGRAVLYRLDPARQRGVVRRDAPALARADESVRDWLGQSVPGWPVYTLGL